MEPKSKLEISKEKLSAFHKYERKRDSGYLTDNSPATPNKQLQFNFDDDIVAEENTFHSDDENDDDLFGECFNDNEEKVIGNIDKEVECAMSLERNTSTCIPVPAIRPMAPVPPVIDNEYPDSCISATEHFTSFRFRRESFQHKSHFRPIVRRTTSTQTPHRHSQIIQQAVSTLSDRFHPYETPLGRGPVHNRLRHNSGDFATVTRSPLPDLIPEGRDRSVSLPDVPALREAQETEIGRELRRISDEFHFSYHSPRQARIVIRRQPGSFPGTWRFGGMWDSLRQLFSPSPTLHDSH